MNDPLLQVPTSLAHPYLALAALSNTRFNLSGSSRFPVVSLHVTVAIPSCGHVRSHDTLVCHVAFTRRNAWLSWSQPSPSVRMFWKSTLASTAWLQEHLDIWRSHTRFAVTSSLDAEASVLVPYLAVPADLAAAHGGFMFP